MKFTKEQMQFIEQSMVKTANAYAATNMNQATAIHDAYLCLIKEIEKCVDIDSK